MSSPLPDLLHSGSLSRTEQLLVCLASLGQGSHATGEIRTVARTNGVSDANVARDLLKLKGLVFGGKSGWTLTTPGRVKATALTGTADQIAPKHAQSLRSLLPKLPQPVRDFVEEAVSCYEAKHFRAAAVLAWVGAVSLLHDHVVQNRLADFNSEALRRDAKWRAAKNADGLARMGEHDFLQILEVLSVVGKNVKTELETCLKLRNGCGHPNSLRIAEHRCSSHLEILMLNVFEAFA